MKEYLTSDFNTWNKENSALYPNSYWNIEYNISYKKIYPLISNMKKNTIPYFISKYFPSKILCMNIEILIQYSRKFASTVSYKT